MFAEILPKAARAAEELAGVRSFSEETVQGWAAAVRALRNTSAVNEEPAFQGIIQARHITHPEIVLAKDPNRFNSEFRPDHKTGYLESYFRARDTQVNLGAGLEPYRMTKLQGVVPFEEHGAGRGLNIISLKSDVGREHPQIAALRPQALHRFDAELEEKWQEGGSAPLRSGVPQGAVDTVFDHTKIRDFALDGLERANTGMFDRGPKFVALNPFTAVYGSHISSNFDGRQVVGLIHSTKQPLDMHSWRLYVGLHANSQLEI